MRRGGRVKQGLRQQSQSMLHRRRRIRRGGQHDKQRRKRYLGMWKQRQQASLQENRVNEGERWLVTWCFGYSGYEAQLDKLLSTLDLSTEADDSVTDTQKKDNRKREGLLLAEKKQSTLKKAQMTQCTCATKTRDKQWWQCFCRRLHFLIMITKPGAIFDIPHGRRELC